MSKKTSPNSNQSGRRRTGGLWAATLLATATLLPFCGSDKGPSDDGEETDTASEPLGDGGDGADSENTVICGDIAPSVTLSERIPTVGVVTFTTALKGIKDARIRFGRDGRTEYTAPVDLEADGYRTLLLGMKPSSPYEFRVIVDTADTTCESSPRTVETGPLATGLPIPKVTTFDADAVSGDFIVTSLLTKRTIFILDKDGDIVWWYNFGNADYEGTELLGFSRAHMSYDGAQMWGGNINFGRGNGRLYRVSMDGADEAEPEITYHHHDFAVLPDNRLALLEFDEDTQGDGTGTCERIVERLPDGTYETAYALKEGLAYLAGPTEWCHCNAIHYRPEEDAFYVSVLLQNLIVKIDRSERRIVWILDGDGPSDEAIGGVPWERQHGFHPLDDDTLLIFNNNNSDDADALVSSRVLAVDVNDTEGTADLDWQYDGSTNTPMLGDVQQLSNGNTLVTYSTAGTLHELDGERQRVRSISFGLGDAVGYSDARCALYGPPDRY